MEEEKRDDRTTSVEWACDYLDQSLEIIMQTQSEGSLQRFLKLKRQLDPWSSTQSVKEIDEQLSSLIGNMS